MAAFDRSRPVQNARPGLLSKRWVQIIAAICGLAILVILIRSHSSGDRSARSLAEGAQLAAVSGPILVSYSYFEKDDIQLKNLQYFVTVGMRFARGFEPPKDVHTVIVVSGELCAPCKDLQPFLKLNRRLEDVPALHAAYTSDYFDLLYRRENEGMDFAAHNVTLDWVETALKHKKFTYFIFLNSSVRGPFFPSYMPPGWQWTRAFTDRFEGDIKVVASSLVCLPEVDAGGPGPRVESWAFAVDAEALDALTAAGVFSTRMCKLCDDGVVVMGEYGLSKVIFDAGWNIATLMSMYPRWIDWRDQRHWHCNDNAHPSRHGTYDGISMHPFETVFIKASWHVGEPHLGAYTRWFRSQAARRNNTEGAFDEALYRYAISPQAQDPNRAVDCFKVIG